MSDTLTDASTEIDAPPLLAALVTRHQAQWIDHDNIAAWRAAQQGDHVMLFAGDPVRFPEALDVAVVLPQLQRASEVAGKPFGLAVAVPDTAQDLALAFGLSRWPTLMFFRDGQYVTTLSGMHDWVDYQRLVAEALEHPISRPPTVGIPVVSANASSNGAACH